VLTAIHFNDQIFLWHMKSTMYFPTGVWRRNLKFSSWRFLSADHNFTSASVALLLSFFAEDLEEIFLFPLTLILMPLRGMKAKVKHHALKGRGIIEINKLAGLAINTLQNAQ